MQIFENELLPFLLVPQKSGIQSELLNLLYNKNTDETSVVFKGPLPPSILDAWPQSMRT